MRFLAIEHELPSRQVTNQDVQDNVRAASARHLKPAELDQLAGLIDACFNSAGTRVRYHRAPDENATDLALRAGRRALGSAGIDPSDVDLLLYVGIGRGVIEPASATIYQDLLGLRRATAFDVLDACASWARALQLAHLFLQSGVYRTVMILNAEFVGRESSRYELRSVDEFAHWHPGVTIGEAATATVLTADNEPDEFESDFRTWGDKRDLCFVPLPSFEGYFGKSPSQRVEVKPLQFFSFGLRLMDFATRKLVEHYRDRPQYAAFEADHVFTHAASDGMTRFVVDQCRIVPDKVHLYHHIYANTISASMPLAMSDAMKKGKLQSGDRVLLLAASAGVTTGLVKFAFHT
jgi:3-oxoacyl-[acyl-carrier-protein] synthase III